MVPFGRISLYTTEPPVFRVCFRSLRIKWHEILFKSLKKYAIKSKIIKNSILRERIHLPRVTGKQTRHCILEYLHKNTHLGVLSSNVTKIVLIFIFCIYHFACYNFSSWSSSECYWIGASNGNANRVYRWINLNTNTGPRVDAGYTNWLPGTHCFCS